MTNFLTSTKARSGRRKKRKVTYGNGKEICDEEDGDTQEAFIRRER